jgi:hypothetical protein
MEFYQGNHNKRKKYGAAMSAVSFPTTLVQVVISQIVTCLSSEVVKSTPFDGNFQMGSCI